MEKTIIELSSGVALIVPEDADADDIAEAFLVLGKLLYAGSLNANGSKESFRKALDIAIEYMRSDEFTEVVMRKVEQA